MKKKILLLSFLLLKSQFVTAQAFFKTELKKDNPVADTVPLPIREKIKIHKAYLQKALAKKDDKKILFGYLYLFHDYKKSADYVNMNDILMRAENLSKKSKNPTWIGEVAMYRGAVYDLDQKTEKALKQYQLALQYCTASKDSICMAENMEQLSATYGQLHDFEKAHHYFKLALPLFKKYNTTFSVSATYNNYSNTLKYEKKYALALKYIDSAYAISVRSKDVYSQMSRKNNKGLLLIEMGEYDKALAIFLESDSIIKKNNWKDRERDNEYGLYLAYKKKGDYQKAIEHFYEYNFYNDSLNGSEVKTRIADLETKYKYQGKELQYKQNSLQLAIAHQKMERYLWLIFIGITFVLIGIWLWRRQTIRTQKELAQRQQDLYELTTLLIEKNALLQAQEENLNRFNTTPKLSGDIETELYNHRILTDTDWTTFKSYFEKAYPNYMFRLRQKHPTITDAEERLFLCLKLNLKSKEIALMLGISNDSVKKNRNRLRKRLELAQEDELAEYVRTF